MTLNTLQKEDKKYKLVITFSVNKTLENKTLDLDTYSFSNMKAKFCSLKCHGQPKGCPLENAVRKTRLNSSKVDIGATGRVISLAHALTVGKHKV